MRRGRKITLKDLAFLMTAARRAHPQETADHRRRLCNHIHVEDNRGVEDNPVSAKHSIFRNPSGSCAAANTDIECFNKEPCNKQQHGQHGWDPQASNSTLSKDAVVFVTQRGTEHRDAEQ